MHELSIAMSIVETIEDAISDQSEASVEAVHIRVGALANVIPEALHFAWGEATRNGKLEGSRLEIEFIEAVAWCEYCNEEVTLPSFKLRCPQCGRSTPKILKGKELDILSVELNDVRTTTTANS